MAAAVGLAGCMEPTPAAPRTELELRREAERYVRAALRFPDNPAVRAQAMEAAAKQLGPEAQLLLKQGLSDDHPSVRFAACMALGHLADLDARNVVQPMVHDADPSVRVAAYFALERMGDPSYREPWRDALLKAEAPEVRRNAALALGRLRNKKVIPLLQKAAAEDRDDGVRLQSLEALAFLGDADAIGRFIHDAYGGLGFRQPFALLTLGHAQGAEVISALRTRLNGAPYIEAKLAAARGLGMHGYDDGFELAVKALRWNSPEDDLPEDPPENQIRRVRTMAAMALGEIGRGDALGALDRLMTQSRDPEVQLAAATAILMILNEHKHGAAGRP